MNTLENLFKSLKRMSLSESEKRAIHASLLTYAHTHPARVPLWIRGADRYGALREFMDAHLSRGITVHPALTACVIVLCVSVGTSYAAEHSLPGDALYMIKTNFDEPLQGALSVSPQAKAEWSTELTDRRLSEAEELAADGRLTPVTQATIVSGLNSAVAHFNTNVALLAQSKDDAGAADAQSNLEASLSAHEDVLTSIADSSSSIQSDVAPIISAVHEHVARATSARHAAVATLTLTDATSTMMAALKVQHDAEHKVRDAKAFAATHQKNATTSATVRSSAVSAQYDIDTGDTDMKGGRWGKAFGAFQAAVRAVDTTKARVDASDRINNKFHLDVTVDATATSTSTVDTSEGTSTDQRNTSDDDSN